MQQVPQGFRRVGRAVGIDLHRDFCELATCEDLRLGATDLERIEQAVPTESAVAGARCGREQMASLDSER